MKHLLIFLVIFTLLTITFSQKKNLKASQSSKTKKHTKTQFSLTQKAIKHFLNRRSVTVRVNSAGKKYAFFTSISKNSRGLLLDMPFPYVVKSDKTAFFSKATVLTKENTVTQALLDFRLVKGCKFESTLPNRRLHNLEFAFRIDAHHGGRAYQVVVKFHDSIRKGDLLVNDEKEFNDVLIHLHRSCKTRKNQLIKRKTWFNEKADKLYKDSVSLNKVRHLEERVFGPTSPFEMDRKLKNLKEMQNDAAGHLGNIKRKAQAAKNQLFKYHHHIGQTSQLVADNLKKLVETKKELAWAKHERKIQEEILGKTQNKLVKRVPQEKERIESAVNDAKKGEEEIAVQLKINS